jgi:anaerobic selenocysteine-containing dehydrogenase
MNQTSRAPGAAVGKTEIRQTTCYMCACRCGINVHMAEGKVHYIEGNRDHPVNKGVLCAKGSAGIMQHYSPARLKKPLLRTRAAPANSGKSSGTRRWSLRPAGSVRFAAPIRASSPFSPAATRARA